MEMRTGVDMLQGDRGQTGSRVVSPEHITITGRWLGRLRYSQPRTGSTGPDASNGGFSTYVPAVAVTHDRRLVFGEMLGPSNMYNPTDQAVAFERFANDPPSAECTRVTKRMLDAPTKENMRAVYGALASDLQDKMARLRGGTSVEMGLEHVRVSDTERMASTYSRQHEDTGYLRYHTYDSNPETPSADSAMTLQELSEPVSIEPEEASAKFIVGQGMQDQGYLHPYSGTMLFPRLERELDNGAWSLQMAAVRVAQHSDEINPVTAASGFKTDCKGILSAWRESPRVISLLSVLNDIASSDDDVDGQSDFVGMLEGAVEYSMDELEKVLSHSMGRDGSESGMAGRLEPQAHGSDEAGGSYSSWERITID